MKLPMHGFTVKTALFGSALTGSVLAALIGMTSLAYAGEQGKVCKHDPVAEMQGHKHGMKGHKHGWHMAKALSLTPEQQQALKDQRVTRSEARQQLREDIHKTETSLRMAVNSGADDSQLQVLADALGKLKATEALERAKSHQAFLAVLTPEQKEKFEQFKTEHKGKMKSWRGKHREHNEEIDS